MFQSAFSCHYWTPLANALMLWDYIVGMKCFDTLMFILSMVRELKNVYTNAFVNYKNISVFYITCTHIFLHRFTKIIHKIQAHIRQFRNICHVLFSPLLVVKVEIVLSLQSAILLHPTLSLEINVHLGPSTIAWSEDSFFLSVRDLACPDVSCEFTVYQPFLQSPKIHLQTTLAT